MPGLAPAEGVDYGWRLTPDLEVIAAVHTVDRKSRETRYELRNRRWRLLADGDRYGVPVVGNDIEHGQAQ